MIRFSKFSQYGIACLSCLAECYDSKNFSRMSSLEIHRKLNISHPTIAKTMNALSIAGFVESTHGPRGGFKLARHPREIFLIEVVRVFEQSNGLPCCQKGAQHKHDCLNPLLHNSLNEIKGSIDSFFKETTLEKVLATPKPNHLSPDLIHKADTTQV